MDRSIYLRSEEVAELRDKKELAKIVLPGSGYDRLDILGCIVTGKQIGRAHV